MNDDERRRQTIDVYVTDLLDGTDPDAAADALLTEDFRFVGPGNAAGINDAEAFAAFQDAMRSALEELRFTLVEAIVDGDAAALVLRMQGWHVGPFAGVDPRGSDVDLELVDVLRFRGERVTAITAYLDAANLRLQVEGL